MGLQLQSVIVVILLAWSYYMSSLSAQSPVSSPGSARSLDSLLQAYAYRAFVRPKTGISYNGTVPSSLTGIKISAMRLRSGSLRTRGVKSYKEFEIAVGVIEKPHVKRLVLVYQNLGNWSSTYYPLRNHTYLSPVLGLLAYTAANLSATNLPELDLRASMNPILIRYSGVESIEGLSPPKCVWFDLNGSANFSSVVSSNTCSTTQQGHFALVVEGIVPPPPPPPPAKEKEKKKKHHHSSKMWIIIGSVLGGVLLLILVAMLLVWLKKYKERKRMQRMEKAADAGEALRQTSVGSAKAPVAFTTRTQPTLETEYVP